MSRNSVVVLLYHRHKLLHYLHIEQTVLLTRSEHSECVYSVQTFSFTVLAFHVQMQEMGFVQYVTILIVLFLTS
jgi:hypothetical protein